MTTEDESNSTQATEHRASPRMAINLPVVLLCPVPDPLCPPFRKVILNTISIGGCSFRCGQDLPVGSDWLLRFDSGDAAAPDTAIRVVRSMRRDDNDWTIGCVFSDISGLVNVAIHPEGHIAPPAIAIQPDTPQGSTVHFDAVFKAASSVDKLTGISIHAEKELSITSSATHCTMDIAGPLAANKAAIVGGRLHVRTTATIGTLGSPQHYLTLVVLGRSFSASLLLAAVPSTLAGPTTELADKLKTIEDIRSAPSGKLTSEERENLTISMCEAQELEKRITRIKHNVRSIKDLDTKPSAIRLEVVNQIYPGVIVAFGDKLTRIDQLITGPATIIVDADGHLALTTPDLVVPRRLAETEMSAAA